MHVSCVLFKINFKISTLTKDLNFFLARAGTALTPQYIAHMTPAILKQLLLILNICEYLAQERTH